MKRIEKISIYFGALIALLTIVVAIDWFSEFRSITGSTDFFILYAFGIGLSIFISILLILILGIKMIKTKTLKWTISVPILSAILSIINWGYIWTDMLI